MPTRIKNATVQPYGHHAYQPVVGLVEPDPGAGYDGKRMMGLPLADHFIYGGLRSLDGEKYYSFFRHYNNQGALGFTAFEADTNAQGQDSDFRFDKQSKQAFVGAAMADQRDGVWGVRDIFDGAPRFEIRASSSGARWFEKGLVDLSLEAAGAVSQIAIPDSQWPLVYNTRCQRAQGNFLGREVTGWIQMDNAYLPDGTCWFQSAYYKAIQGAWTDFVTEYDDGAFDHGVMFCGKQQFNAFCVESSDRDPVVVHDPDFEIELDENEYPLRMSVDAGGGEIWDWKRLPGDKARVPSITVENSPRWIQGYFTRRGETRAVKSADGWVESFKRGVEHLI